MQTVIIRFFDKKVGYKAANFLRSLGYEVNSIGQTYWNSFYPFASCILLEISYEN
ncbi:hypothetical protein [Caproiciproducens faecalis]|uniref:Uncharacterized protein n=1 Tax=Caproiciproducens faecalis TaxID=2820301 RepID=A0ABS7DPU6_9FIRM|nr:hypothetical protein [Caproiciproducens faecalis]MBW7573334.1 hypothetical protein [Caproiciproducens faecalis]